MNSSRQEDKAVTLTLAFLREEEGTSSSVYERADQREGQLSLVAFTIYLFLACALTYPMLVHVTTHIPGGNVDEGAFLWNIWWIKYALLDLRTNPLVTDVIFYPLGVNLALYTLTPLNGLLALPLTLTAGPIVASNILFLLAFALSSLGAFLLTLDTLESRRLAAVAAAFVAGLVYAFASGRFIYASLGQYDYVSSQWLPLAMLFFLRTLRRPGWRSPLLTGLFAACAGLTEMNFVVFLLVFVLAALTLTAMRRMGAGLVSDGLTRRLVLALLVFTIGFGPLGMAVVRETLHAGDYIVRGWGGAETYVIDLLGPVVPSPLHPILGDWAQQVSRRFTDINFAFVGYMTLMLAAIGIGCAKQSRFWLTIALLFFVLALGPLLHVNGQSTFEVDGLLVNIPLLYIIIHYIPILKGARIPGRFAIMATVAVAVLAALGWSRILERVKQRNRQMLMTVVLSLVILVENVAVPLPLTDATVPEPYWQIAVEPGDFAILQVPLGWRDGFGTVGRERTLLQSYQSVHGKRILGGNTSRTPTYVLSYFARMPILRSIVALEEDHTLEPGVLEADRAAAPEVLAFLDVRYIVIHGDYIGSPVDSYVQSVLPVQRVAVGTGQVTNAFWQFDSQGKRVDVRKENAAWVLYKVDVLSHSTVSVDLGTEGAQMHLAAGWSRAETMGDITFSWAEERQALVLLRLDQLSDAILVLRAAPFSYPGWPGQRVDAAVNGHTVGTVEMSEGWAEYRLPVPASYLRRGINTVRLAFVHLASPADVLGTSDRRMLAAAVDWIRLEVATR